MVYGISKSSAITCNDSPISRLAKIVAQVVAIFSVRSPPVRLRCAVNIVVNSSMRSGRKFVLVVEDVFDSGFTQFKQVCPSPKVVL